MFDTNYDSSDLKACVEIPYHGEDHSLSMKLFYGKFCDNVCMLFPPTLAPNTITFLGFVFEFTSFLLSFITSKGLTQPQPWWVSIIGGICLFIYQTCDNVDGRQARRTGSGSAIGQFFDHAVDAFVDVFEMLKVCAVFQFGRSLTTWVIAFSIAVGYYVAFWNQYVNNMMYLGWINFCIEGLFIFSTCQIVIGLKPDFYEFGQNLFFRILTGSVTAITISYTFFYMFYHAFKDTSKMYNTVMSFLPVFTTSALTIMNIVFDKSVVGNIWFTFGTALTVMYNTQRIVITHICGRKPTRLFDWATICYWFGIAAFMIPQLHNIEHYWLCYFISIFSGMLIFDYQTLTNLSKGLKIPIFSIKPKVEEENKKIK